MEVRAGAAPAPESADFTAGDLAPDFALHEVRRRRAALALSPLGCLPPVELAHQYLLERVRGRIARDVRYLKDLVGRLRRKPGGDAARPRYIATVWGTDYRLRLPPEPSQPCRLPRQCGRLGASPWPRPPGAPG